MWREPDGCSCPGGSGGSRSCWAQICRGTGERRTLHQLPQSRPRAAAKPAPPKGFSHHRHYLENGAGSTHYERDQALQDFTQHQCCLYLDSHEGRGPCPRPTCTHPQGRASFQGPSTLLPSKHPQPGDRTRDAERVVRDWRFEPVLLTGTGFHLQKGFSHLPPSVLQEL